MFCFIDLAVLEFAIKLHLTEHTHFILLTFKPVGCNVNATKATTKMEPSSPLPIKLKSQAAHHSYVSQAHWHQQPAQQ